MPKDAECIGWVRCCWYVNAFFSLAKGPHHCIVLEINGYLIQDSQLISFFKGS